MSWLPEFREVRVTARLSVTTPFVAPEIAPVSTHQIELAKGSVGWTDHDLKLSNAPYNPRTGTGVAGGCTIDLDAQRLDQAMVSEGPVFRAARNRVATQDVTGPSAKHQAMRDAAQRLAARNQR
jgi:hypothetical protein